LSRAPDVGELTGGARFLLLEECRRQKEALHPNKRKITIDLGRAVEGGGRDRRAVDEFYQNCIPLIERTVEAMERAMERLSSSRDWGGVTLPPFTSRADRAISGGRAHLRDRHGRRVRRSPFPYSATAIAWQSPPMRNANRSSTNDSLAVSASGGKGSPAGRWYSTPSS